VTPAARREYVRAVRPRYTLARLRRSNCGPGAARRIRQWTEGLSHKSQLAEDVRARLTFWDNSNLLPEEIALRVPQEPPAAPLPLPYRNAVDEHGRRAFIALTLQ
jgi:hypothetical protein